MIFLRVSFTFLLYIFFILYLYHSIDLTANGPNVGGNLGTVINVGNFFQSSDDNVIECQATIRVVDVRENTNGRARAVVFNTNVNGFGQPSSSLLLKVRASFCLDSTQSLALL